MIEAPRVISVECSMMADHDADTSYLEQEDWEGRLAAYRNGDFGFVGVRASAQVVYGIDGGCQRIETFTSGGLWGIEDDSGKEYFDEVFSDEIDDLRAHLERFGVDTSDWAALTAHYPCRLSACPDANLEHTLDYERHLLPRG